ncbi:MAG TPA: MAPEG family protein [Rhizomicrobium sp.]|nr:MAPEG family protein [Rhizomicrobium sp.]
MTMAFPYFTAATAAMLAVLQMLLLLYTANGRGKYQAGLGDGGNAALLTRIRMHGNLAENAPLFLILLGLVEMSGQWPAFVPWIAIAFVIVRLSHAIGLAMSSGVTVFRFVGALGTVVTILMLAVLLFITLSHDTSWMSPAAHG